MDESIGMLSVAAVLVFGVWLVDYAGDATRASHSVRAAGIEAAHYAAGAVASPPDGVDAAEMQRAVQAVAERIVGAAAVSDCDTADPGFEVEATVHRLRSDGAPAAVSVEVDCPLSVSPLFADTVRARAAAAVPGDLAAPQ
ncbi:hypothetical protein [Candidatus Poriferisodalis sp.]|uniref:hypothetical protein n=1 Tax=Candidatus Poriferisodalis sp. TaxID=3101277 RepID=UPI003B01C27D